MTPLRQRFIDDLRLRNKSPRTIQTYVLRVALFARHFGRSPEVLGPEEIRAYQQDLLARQVSLSQFNQAVCALRFLYHVTLGRPEVIRHLPFAKRPRTLPTVLSPEEVTRLLAAALPGRQRTLLDVAYSCGLPADGVAYLGPEPAPSSARSLRGDGRRGGGVCQSGEKLPSPTTALKSAIGKPASGKLTRRIFSERS